MPPNAHDLVKKIEQLPAARIEEVADFVDFLRAREIGRALTQNAAAASAASFGAIWDNPDDAVYDVL